jgi:hypothetical protein
VRSLFVAIYLMSSIRFRAHIQGRLQISKDLKQRQVGEEATKGQGLIRSMHKVSGSHEWHYCLNSNTTGIRN